MDVLEHAYSVVFVIIEAIQTCKGARASNTSGGSSREWISELGFCFSLQSALEDIVAWKPSDTNFAHDYELRGLTHTISHHLEHFCDVLATCIPTLQDACEHFDPSKQDDAARLQSQLRNSFMQPVKTLRKQVAKYIPAINTLLLLYVIAVLRSPPLEPIPEDQIADLKNIGQRAKVLFEHNLQKLLQSPSTTQKLSIPDQQSFLASLERDAKRHWESVQVTINGAWGDAMELSDNDLSSATSSGLETPRVILSNNQGSSQKYQTPPRKSDNEKRSDDGLRKLATQHANVLPGPLKTHNQIPEHLGARIPSHKAEKAYSGPTITYKQPPPATDIKKAAISEGSRSFQTTKNVISPSPAVESYTNRPANEIGHKPAGMQTMAGSRNRPSNEGQAMNREPKTSSEHQNLQFGQLKVQSEQGNPHRGGADARLRVEDNAQQYHQRQQHSEGTPGRLRQQNEQPQPPSRPLQSQGQVYNPQQQAHQQRQQIPMQQQKRPNQQEQSRQQQPLRQVQPHSQYPQKPQRSDQPGPATSDRAGSSNSGGRSNHQTALPARNIQNSSMSRRVE